MSPIRSEQHVIAQDGIQIIERFFLEKGWIVRRQNADYGIDLEVEIASLSGAVTGKLFKIQCKTHKNIRFNGDVFRQPVLLEHGSYWDGMNVPVFLFVVDVSTQKIYWVDASEGFRESFKEAQVSIGFRIRKQSDLAIRESCEELYYCVEHFHGRREFRDNAIFLLTKFDYFIMLYERIHCSDAFPPIEVYGDALKKHFEYLIGFPCYMFSTKHEKVYKAFRELTNQIDLDLIAFHRAIPICDTILQWYYEVIVFIILRISCEYEYWRVKDSVFLETIEHLRIPKSSKEEDVLRFCIDSRDQWDDMQIYA